MKNFLESKKGRSEEFRIQNEMKICQHFSNEERNNDNCKILSLLKNDLLYSLNKEEDKLIKRAIYEILIRYSTFFNEPASTKYHGAYKGGLVDHSLAVYLAAIRTSFHYGIQADEVNPITCLFHDICKVGKYKLVKDDKKGDNGFKYIYNNDYNGIEHGAESLRRLLNIDGIKEMISEPWQIAIAYHMGVFGVSNTEMQNFSTMSERYPEVLLLHHADMIATKIYDL
jgi:hypothetical protein